MIKYEHKNFHIEKCGWCNQNAVPRVKDTNGRLRLYYKKFLCNSEDCKRNRKKCNSNSYIVTKNTYQLNDEEAKLRVQKSSPFHREYFKSDEEYKKFQAQCSLRAFCDRYGKIVGEKEFKKYKSHRSYLASEKYFIKKLGKKDGKIKYQEIQKQKAITMENLTRKYGKIEGIKRYKSFLDKTLKNFVSKKSINFLNTISNLCNLEIRHGQNSSEKKIVCKKTVHPVDGYCKKLNVVFEFFGDKWHVNPKLYNENDTNIGKKSAKEVWKKDLIRLRNISLEVSAIFICWEYSWKYEEELVINQINTLIKKLKSGKLKKGIYYLGESYEYISS